MFQLTGTTLISPWKMRVGGVNSLVGLMGPTNSLYGRVEASFPWKTAPLASAFYGVERCHRAMQRQHPVGAVGACVYVRVCVHCVRVCTVCACSVCMCACVQCMQCVRLALLRLTGNNVFRSVAFVPHNELGYVVFIARRVCVYACMRAWVVRV
jgi:hypothetical protein